MCFFCTHIRSIYDERMKVKLQSVSSYLQICVHEESLVPGFEWIFELTAINLHLEKDFYQQKKINRLGFIRICFFLVVNCGK